MTNAKIEAAYQNSNPDKFKEAAKYVVKHYVSSPKNGPELTEEARSVIAAVTAEDMATGARKVYSNRHYHWCGSYNSNCFGYKTVEEGEP